MTYDVDKSFEELEYLFHSKKRKRRPKEVVEEEDEWYSKPLIKTVKGKQMEFYYIGDLARALGKSVKTVRYWEQKAFIPRSPYRLPGYMRGTKKIGGKRLLTKELIDVTVDEFSKRGLLGKARVDWKLHDDLTIALVEKWSTTVNRNA